MSLKRCWPVFSRWSWSPLPAVEDRLGEHSLSMSAAILIVTCVACVLLPYLYICSCRLLMIGFQPMMQWWPMTISLNLCLWSKGEYWKRWVWSGRGWSTEMSLLRLPWSQRFSFIKMIQGIFFIHGVHGLALAVPYPFFLQVLLNVLSSASWL